MEEESWRWNHERVILEESWRRNHGGGIMEEESWRKNHEGGIIWEASRWEASGRHPEASGGYIYIYIGGI